MTPQAPYCANFIDIRDRKQYKYVSDLHSFFHLFFLGDLVLIACRAVGVIVLPWTQGEFNVFSYGLQAIGLDD